MGPLVSSFHFVPFFQLYPSERAWDEVFGRGRTLRAIGHDGRVQHDGCSRLIPKGKLGTVVLVNEPRIRVLDFVNFIKEVLSRHDLVGHIRGDG